MVTKEYRTAFRIHAVLLVVLMTAWLGWWGILAGIGINWAVAFTVRLLHEGTSPF